MALVHLCCILTSGGGGGRAHVLRLHWSSRICIAVVDRPQILEASFIHQSKQIQNN